MTIARKIWLYFLVLTLLLLSLVSTLWLMYRNLEALHQGQELRFEAHELAEELSQSSNDLTRMARTYVITGDKRYKEYFNTILAIREGTAPRPHDYGHAYWDFMVNNADHPVRLGEPAALMDLINKIHYTSQEFAYLAKAKALSDQLALVERQAFHAMEGSFQDAQGNYTVKGPPDPELARRLLFSPDYHQAKAEIMRLVEDFEEKLDARGKAAVERLERQEINLTVAAILLALLLLAVSLGGYAYFKLGIIKPLDRIQGWIGQVEQNHYDLEPDKVGRDEIGKIAVSFSRMAHKVASQMEILEKSSLTDSLTGLNNRGGLNRALNLQKYSFERYGTDCAVIMFDLDHFKQINDQQGHLTGDQVIMETAAILASKVRQSDVIGRWGGDEFMVICPSTALDGGRSLAELLRLAIWEHEFSGVGRRTASFGVGCFAAGLSVEEVVNRADQALYRAKQEGRDRVV